MNARYPVEHQIIDDIIGRAKEIKETLPPVSYANMQALEMALKRSREILEVLT